MSGLSQAAQRAAVAKALADRVADLRKETSDDLRELMDAGDRKNAVLDDGTSIGTVSFSKPSRGARIVDPAALLEWVQQNAPAEVEVTTRVRPAFERALLGNVDETDTGAVDPRTGEVVPGIEFRTGTSSIRVSITDDQADALAEAWVDGRLTGVVSDVLAIGSDKP